MNLDAVRAALIADARSDAELILAEADRDVAARRADTQREAELLIETGRSQGARDADARLARRRAETRRESRQLVLAAQRRALDALRDRARSAARELGTEDAYPELLDRLRLLAVTQLGPGAAISVTPGGEPGVTATDGRRRVDYRLVTLADRAVDALGADVEMLWK